MCEARAYHIYIGVWMKLSSIADSIRHVRLELGALLMQFIVTLIQSLRTLFFES